MIPTYLAPCVRTVFKGEVDSSTTCRAAMAPGQTDRRGPECCLQMLFRYTINFKSQFSVVQGPRRQCLHESEIN
jgi:hypothetical protein